MGMFADAVGTSRPNIYTYFPNLEAVLDALLEERLAAIQPELKELVVPGQPMDFAALFEVLRKHRQLILLLNCGGSLELRQRREAFDDAMIGGMAQALGSERLKAEPLLLPLVAGTLRGAIYEAVVREDPTADAAALAAKLNDFIRGGVQGVLAEK